MTISGAIRYAPAVEGSINLIYVTAPLRKLSDVIETARKVDPDIFYLVERAQVWSDNLLPIHNPTGWRAISLRGAEHA